MATLDLPGLPEGLLPALAGCLPGERLALVGGAVRDLLLHRQHRDPWRGLMDLDLVVEVPVQRFVQAVAACPQLDLRSAREHGRYGTVELELRYGALALLLDVARARRETYAEPGGKPSVRFDRLEADLARRDFTINAMALVLDPSGVEGVVLDPHGGLGDLAERQLRLLHGESLRDDPTRLVRAARYAARLGFALSPEALAQCRSTLKGWPWRWKPGDDPADAPASLASRLRMELDLLLDREPWPVALDLLQAWGGLVLLHPALQHDTGWPRRLHWAKRLSLPRLPALLATLEDPVPIAQRLQLPHAHCRLLAHWRGLRQRLSDLAAEPPEPGEVWLPSRWTAFLEASPGSADAVGLALITGLGPRRPLLRWWLRWRHQTSPVSSHQLIAAGISPGPGLGERLRHARFAAIDAQEAAGAVPHPNSPQR